jgi:hypothetical protein
MVVTVITWSQYIRLYIHHTFLNIKGDLTLLNGPASISTPCFNLDSVTYSTDPSRGYKILTSSACSRENGATVAAADDDDDDDDDSVVVAIVAGTVYISNVGVGVVVRVGSFIVIASAVAAADLTIRKDGVHSPRLRNRDAHKPEQSLSSHTLLRLLPDSVAGPLIESYSASFRSLS